VKIGDRVRIGSATVQVLRASHDRVLGEVPFPGPARHSPPTHVDDWICGETLAYIVEMGGQRIYLAAGSKAHDAPPPGLGHIDLAIQGLATPDAQAALPGILARLQPEYLLPSHMDNFFRPLERGFSFLPLTDFPRTRRTVEQTRSRLILLDYFRPWTLR
jgi:L-ascorbate metabolism protein UlaG (beta-lactamase superfamily)